MKLHRLLLAAAAVALAGPIAAHAADPNAATPAPSADAKAPAATGTAAPAAAELRSSPTPVGEAGKLKAGDPTVVSNDPIPDTPENRAKYGKPLSRTGQRSAAAGN